MVLWKGVGGSFSPNVPLIDGLIGKRLQARGFQGTRDKRKCLFAATQREHALEYTPNEDPDFLRVLAIEEGAIVTWGVGEKDLVMGFETFYRSCLMNRDFVFKGKDCTRLLLDTGISIDVLETYLRLNRQKVAISKIIDTFLDDITFQEHIYQDEDALETALGDHQGEVWITGKVNLLHEHELTMAAPSLMTP